MFGKLFALMDLEKEQIIDDDECRLILFNFTAENNKALLFMILEMNLIVSCYCLVDRKARVSPHLLVSNLYQNQMNLLYKANVM